MKKSNGEWETAPEIYKRRYATERVVSLAKSCPRVMRMVQDNPHMFREVIGILKYR